ncbi:MAG: FAD-binding oxidoreductase [Aphanothece sp. CMT-3BRIN-NPC111]|nr:FAD-binding oxidoreductase [Aphanothece sp. CMT-3BRIN-NPC111]
MSHVVLVGCGVVGAAIAYELSQVPGLSITVLDKQPPAQGATGAALGVLMGVISHKIKGNAWKMRQASIQRYETLIPELEALTGRKIPFNRQGILMLCFEGDDLASWEKLVKCRQTQGWQLEIWDTAQLHSRCPHLNNENITAAVYSPQDRQLDPTALTLALVKAAESNGVKFQFDVTVGVVESTPEGTLNINQIQTTGGEIAADWLVVTAGLGSTGLTASLKQPVDIRPVLGQALHLQLEHSLGRADFQPVITGDDVHIVPVGKGEYWVGATVEFPADEGELVPDAAYLEVVRQKVIAFCPALSEATVIRTWSGLRPRPEGRPAPIIGHLPGYSNVLLATGHYRNGVLLAPATAQAIRQAIIGG